MPLEESVEELIKPLSVERVWVFYGSIDAPIYVEEQLIKKIKGVSTVFNTRPLMLEELKNIKLLSQNVDIYRQRFSNVIAPNVLYFDTSQLNIRLIWYISPSIKPMRFDKSLKIDNGSYAVPGIIFDYCQGETKVYAYKEISKNREKTKLYHLPLFNISNDGSLCWGNVMDKEIEYNCFEDLMKKVEGLFFESKFTHSGATDVVCKIPLITYWQMAKNKQEFDNSVLKANGKKIEDII